jgi:hypothetical protein
MDPAKGLLMRVKPDLHGLRDCRRVAARKHHEPGRHRRAKRSVGTAFGAAGCLLLGLAIVVPVAMQARAGATGATTAARLSASTRALTPMNIPSPRLPVKLPPPVRLTVTPQRAVGDLVPFDYMVRWSQTRKPVGLPGEKPVWLVSTRFSLMQPGRDIQVWSQQRLLPIWMRKYSGTQELTPGVWKIVTTVEDAQGEIGWALEVVEVIKPPPPPPSTPKPTPRPTTTTPQPTPRPTTTTPEPTPRPTTTMTKTPKPEPTTTTSTMP